jgi:hypothetical protein
MQLALRGLGATYIDTGAGITPTSFPNLCCEGWFGTTFASQECKDWANANAQLFGGSGACYCCKVGTDNLLMSQGVAKIPVVAPPAPPINAGGNAMVPVVTCPAAVYPCPCDGRLVQTAQDAQDLLTCQALQQQALQNAAIAAGMQQTSSDICTAQAAACAASTFSAFLSPSADCTTCVMDFTKGATLAVIAALALFVFLAVKR